MANRSRAALQTFADDFYFGNEGEKMTLAQAAGILNKTRSFNAALLIGRINMKSSIGNFLRLFPNKFKIEGNYVQVQSSSNGMGQGLPARRRLRLKTAP